MRDDLERRARELAVYLIERRTTIRDAAKHFSVSKSTVHVDGILQNVSGGSSRKATPKGGKQSLPALWRYAAFSTITSSICTFRYRLSAKRLSTDGKLLPHSHQ